MNRRKVDKLQAEIDTLREEPTWVSLVFPGATTMSELRRTPEQYLEAAYSRVIVPDSDTGTFTARILEFPACVTEGETAPEALERLEAVARDWLVAAIERGQPVPEPLAGQSHSGRVLLRLPKSVHRRSAEYAGQEGVSLNQFLVSTISERLGVMSATHALDAANLGSKPQPRRRVAAR